MPISREPLTTPAMPEYVRRSVDLALDNVAVGSKPFACVVVDSSTGAVLHEATNQVAQSGDLTAHAESPAIRALAAQGRGDLSGCDVYVTAYAKAADERALPAEQGGHGDPTAPFRAWQEQHSDGE